MQQNKIGPWMGNEKTNCATCLLHMGARDWPIRPSNLPDVCFFIFIANVCYLFWYRCLVWIPSRRSRSCSLSGVMPIWYRPMVCPPRTLWLVAFLGPHQRECFLVLKSRILIGQNESHDSHRDTLPSMSVNTYNFFSLSMRFFYFIVNPFSSVCSFTYQTN